MLLNWLLGLAFALAGLVALAFAGLRVTAPAFPPPAAPAPLPPLPLPPHLPPPVARFARAVYGGDTLPQVRTALVLGRGRLIRNGLALPARLRISYDVARASYYHDFQITWFGIPFLRVHERYLDGHALLALPGERVENDPFTDAAAKQGFWSEALAWLPAAVLADPRVRWEVLGEHSARLYLPDADDSEAFDITFDPDTGLLATLTTQRYQDSRSGGRKRWRNRALRWERIGDYPTMARAETQWDDDAPWAQWAIDHVVYNAEVAKRLAQFGGEV